MVEDQIVRRGVKNESVLEAMRCVPRHWFVPASEQANAYQDSALPIGQGQTISQPYIVALMSEALTLSREDRVLEVGTGSGYQAAVLSELVSQVWTIEIDEVLAERAARTLRERGYTTIQARQGDGYAGWPEAAPFNAIIVTCAPSKIPAPLLEQLAVGGRLCIPVGDVDEVQRLVLVTKQPDGSTQSEVLELVRFVPMTGRSQKE
jgi:protein-L-isoaspartate(D-aspartate) O-methyltransferase